METSKARHSLRDTMCSAKHPDIQTHLLNDLIHPTGNHPQQFTHWLHQSRRRSWNNLHHRGTSTTAHTLGQNVGVYALYQLTRIKETGGTIRQGLNTNNLIKVTACSLTNYSLNSLCYDNFKLKKVIRTKPTSAQPVSDHITSALLTLLLSTFQLTVAQTPSTTNSNSQYTLVV